MSYRIICWLIILFACFYGLGNYPLLDNNEGMYAAVARDMLRSHEFIIPHLNSLPYIEKPPLFYWLTALSFWLFGINETAARLVPCLAVFATACAIQRFARRHTNNDLTGDIAALIFATSMPMLVMARMVLFDMLMTCFLSAALMCFYNWHAGSHKRWLTGFYALLALAVLTKTLLAIALAGGCIGTFMLWQRTPRNRYFELLSLPDIALFLLIAAPWHIAASLQEPGFAWFYFVNEHFLRFINLRQPHDYHTGPLWYYLPRVLGYLLPWTLFLVPLLRHPLHGPDRQPALTRFLWSWFLFCFIFFSAAGGKANYYMLPGMPPLFLLLGWHIEPLIAMQRRIIPALASGCLLLVMALLIAMRIYCQANGSADAACQEITLPVIALGMGYAIGALALCWTIPPRWIVPLVAAHILLFLPLLIAGTGDVTKLISQQPVADFLRQTKNDDAALYRDFENVSALAFYLDRPIPIVDSKSSDLLYGQLQAKDSPVFLTLAQWAAHKPHIALVVPNEALDDVNAKLAAMKLKGEHGCTLQPFQRVTVLRLTKTTDGTCR